MLRISSLCCISSLLYFIQSIQFLQRWCAGFSELIGGCLMLSMRDVFSVASELCQCKIALYCRWWIGGWQLWPYMSMCACNARYTLKGYVDGHMTCMSDWRLFSCDRYRRRTCYRTDRLWLRFDRVECQGFRLWKKSVLYSYVEMSFGLTLLIKQ